MKKPKITKLIAETKDFIIVLDDETYEDYPCRYVLPKFLGKVYPLKIGDIPYYEEDSTDIYDFRLVDTRVSEENGIKYYDFSINGHFIEGAIQVTSGVNFKTFLTNYNIWGIDDNYAMIITKTSDSDSVTIQYLFIDIPYHEDGSLIKKTYPEVNPIDIIDDIPRE